ncbi:MAG: hypothetical protein KDK48_05635, partial [Chlamydiia bacterium]|nr:hypothetical protein [Chlamydiia bacterium]
LSAKKTLRYYFSSSGRGEGDPSWHGTNRVDLLGYSLDATGKYGISKVRQKRLFQKISARIKNTAKLTEGEPLEKRGFILCAIVNSYMKDISLGNNMALTAIRYTNDGDQLKHLDLMIARKIAEAATGIRGVKAFRTAPYRTIRDYWGLKSFVQLRNEL